MKYITPKEAENYVPIPYDFRYMRSRDIAYYTFVPSKRGPEWEDVIYYLPRLKNLYKNRIGKGDSWIYILSNESQPGMYKIGFTSQDDVETRVKQLSRSTSVATPFFLEWAFRCFNAAKLEQEIHNCIKILKTGGIILYPTDTVWGIGCDANNPEAVKKVYTLKNRVDSKALIALVASELMLERTVIYMPDIAWDLIDAAEKPLTIIYQEVKGVAHNAIAEDGSCAIRLPKDNFCQQLVQRLGKPLISTSANTSGTPTPQSFQDIEPSILSGVDYVVNLRQQEECKNTPSSIILLKKNGEIKIIR